MVRKRWHLKYCCRRWHNTGSNYCQFPSQRIWRYFSDLRDDDSLRPIRDANLLHCVFRVICSETKSQILYASVSACENRDGPAPSGAKSHGTNLFWEAGPATLQAPVKKKEKKRPSKDTFICISCPYRRGRCSDIAPRGLCLAEISPDTSWQPRSSNMHTAASQLRGKSYCS